MARKRNRFGPKRTLTCPKTWTHIAILPTKQWKRAARRPPLSRFN